MPLMQNKNQNWQQLHISLVARWANSIHACMMVFVFSTSNCSATNDYWKIFWFAKFAKSSRSAHGQPLQPHKYNKIILSGWYVKWTCKYCWECTWKCMHTHTYIRTKFYVWLGKRKSIKCIVFAWKIDLFRIKLVDTLPHV